MDVSRAVDDDQLALGLHSQQCLHAITPQSYFDHYLAPAEVAVYCLIALDAVLCCPVGIDGCLSEGLGRLWGSAVFGASDLLR